MDSEARDLNRQRDDSLRYLASEILHDSRTLLEQHVELAKADLRQSLDDTMRAVIPLAIAAAFGGLASVLFCLTLVRLLNAVTEIPLWAAYGIITIILAALAGILAAVGVAYAKKIKNPAKTTSEVAKENLAWLKDKTIARHG